MKKMILFSSLIPKGEQHYYTENSIGATSNANNSLQWAIVKGFVENDYQVKLFNLPNIGAFPFKFKKLITKSFLFREENIRGENIGIINVNIFKHFFAYRNLLKLIKINNYLSEETFLLIYDVYPPFLKVIKKLKHKNPLLKIGLVIPDIYGYTGGKESFLRNIIAKHDLNIIEENILSVDVFVLLTENMIDKLPYQVKQKPRVIIEGVLNPDYNLEIINKVNDQDKIILYTGSLDLRHGIKNLIDAFSILQYPNLKLHICGDGDGRFYVDEKSSIQDNITYFGQLSREDVIQKQKEAFLLINPRTSEGEFTRYSFPSKIIEYFASGTPTLMYNLEGIPSEYFEHCFSLEDESVEALAFKIDEIYKMDEEKLYRIGLKAKKFITDEKNSKSQVDKIIKILNRL